jgi:hypothetical protein
MTYEEAPLVLLIDENESQNQSCPGKPGRQRGCAPSKAASSQRENENEKENKMKKRKLMLILTLFMACVLAPGCAKNSEEAASSSTTAAVSTTCETTYQTVSTPANGYQSLCTPAAGAGKFFRIEGTSVNLANKYFYLILGDSDANRVGTNTTPTNNAGERKLSFIFGASAGSQPWTYFTFNGNSTTQFTYPLHTIAPLTANGPSTVCFEVTDTVPPQVTFWVTGYKTDGSANQTGMTADASVDCANTATLTRANAVMTKVDWNTAASLASGSAYIKSSGTSATDIAKVTKVFVSSNPVIGATDVCSTEPGSGTTQICAPSKGLARHYRIEGVQTTNAHSSVTLYTGYSSQPSGGQAATAGGQSRTIFYHGNGAAPPPATTVNYGNQDVTVSPAFTAFTTAAQEVCMDITDATPPRITLWATGVNSANCKDRTTLTAANSLLNKNDWTSATAANNAAAYLYRGAGTSATKVTAYATIFGTGF